MTPTRPKWHNHCAKETAWLSLKINTFSFSWPSYRRVCILYCIQTHWGLSSMQQNEHVAAFVVYFLQCVFFSLVFLKYSMNIIFNLKFSYKESGLAHKTSILWMGADWSVKDFWSNTNLFWHVYWQGPSRPGRTAWRGNDWHRIKLRPVRSFCHIGDSVTSEDVVAPLFCSVVD